MSDIRRDALAALAKLDRRHDSRAYATFRAMFAGPRRRATFVGLPVLP